MGFRTKCAFLAAALLLAAGLPSIAAPPAGGQAGKGAGGPPSVGMMASKMIQQFDRNGDQALNAQELAAALTAMRENRGEGKKGPGGGKKPGGAGKP